jgi:3-oxoacyl-[acyl-carrier protein] reductase
MEKIKVRTILITGASSGIGYQTALLLSKMENVAVVAIARNNEKLDKLKSESGDKILTLAFDLEEKNYNPIFDFLKANNITALDGLIHNAGLLINKPFENISLEDLNRSYHVNVFAPYLLTQALLPYLKNAPTAHVVTISSMGGVQGSMKFAGLSAYSSSKGALSLLTECLAVELEKDKIRVNCLALGSVQTEMLNEAFPGFKAPLEPKEMGEYISWFILNGHHYYNGKILPVAVTTP